MLKQTKFSHLQILKQLKQDLWCKEITTGYTPSYSWCANQLGHFTLGFAPTILIAQAVKAIIGPTSLIALVSLVPVLYMMYKEQQDKQLEVSNYKHIHGLVPLDVGGLNKNIWTTHWFVFAGASLAASLFISFPFFWILPPVLLLLLLIPSWLLLKYWVSQKVCFQQATLPYIFRLSYYPLANVNNSTQAREYIKAFVSGQLEHLIVCGPPKSGKTKLAAAIGTGMAFQLNVLRYTDLFSFFRDAASTETVHSGFIPWPYIAAQTLIIDDVEYERIQQLAEPGYSEFKDKHYLWLIETDADQFMELLAQVFGRKSMAVINLI